MAVAVDSQLGILRVGSYLPIYIRIATHRNRDSPILVASRQALSSLWDLRSAVNTIPSILALGRLDR